MLFRSRQNAAAGDKIKSNEVIAGRTAFAENKAILTAQGAYKEATFAENSGGSDNNGTGAAFGNPNITRQGITSAYIRNQAVPGRPTDGTGQSLGDVPVTVVEGPPKLSLIDRARERLGIPPGGTRPGATLASGQKQATEGG